MMFVCQSDLLALGWMLAVVGDDTSRGVREPPKFFSFLNHSQLQYCTMIRLPSPIHHPLIKRQLDMFVAGGETWQKPQQTLLLVTANRILIGILTYVRTCVFCRDLSRLSQYRYVAVCSKKFYLLQMVRKRCREGNYEFHLNNDFLSPKERLNGANHVYYQSNPNPQSASKGQHHHQQVRIK